MDATQIVNEMPEGYRWATTAETERWTEVSSRLVQVRTGGTDDEPETDLAFLPFPPKPTDIEVIRAINTLLPTLSIRNYVDRWADGSPAVSALNTLRAVVGEAPVRAGEKQSGSDFDA